MSEFDRKFAGVGIIKREDTVVYRCLDCGKVLNVVSMDYYGQNIEVATEDLPLQLRKEHVKKGCSQLKKDARKNLDTLKDVKPNTEVTEEEMYNSLAGVEVYK